MRLPARFMDRLRPAFREDGRLRPLWPIFQALDNFLFASPETTIGAPYGRDPLDVKRVMSLAIVALMPCLLVSVYFFGVRVLLMVLVSYAAGGAVEVLFALVRKEEINEGFLVTGFIFPLVLPPALPLWLVAVGMVFGVLVGKEVFGGTGRNLFNPALVGRVFLALGYPAAMTSAWIEPGAVGRFVDLVPDAVSRATPLVAAKGGEPAAGLDLFVGRVLGSAGETSAVAILIGGLFLLAVGIANWRTVVSILASFVGLTALLRLIAPGATGPIWFNLGAGGFLFGTFFMATDPVTGPVTTSGKWFYGVLIGAATILIRTYSGFVEGMMFAILLGNISAPLIDEAVVRLRSRRYAGAR